jgi:predicted HTH transcriptional regulator
MTSVPKWANEKLSQNLPAIRELGETDQVEFKRQIPDNKSKLAQELAAFGTSGGGCVFIGIDDDGKLHGISAKSGEDRDDLAERLHGIARIVRPDLNFSIKFAVENSDSVVVMIVPSQEHPVFYSDGRPYIREKRRAQPATPEQVQSAVWKHPSSDLKRELEILKLKEEQERQKHNQMFRGIKDPI